MTFREAQAFIIPYGKYRDQTIDQVASTDAGLLYLDWLRGHRESKSVDSPFDVALGVYLDDPSVARDVQVLLG